MTRPHPLTLTAARSIVVISDFADGWPPSSDPRSLDEAAAAWSSGQRGPAPQPLTDIERQRDELQVIGGYLERLPLAAIKHGLADYAEIWHHWRPDTPPPFVREHPLLARRAFHLDSGDAPYASNDMLGFLETFGAPDILCVWGLGVDERILAACANSLKIYNSIDAPTWRLPPEVSRHFDLVLTGAQWQSDEVHERHPDMATMVLPIGPEFASPQTFYPTASDKQYDLIYVAAAQGYKRHDILFDALDALPRSIRALCVFGYGELAEPLRHEARERNLNIDFVGPPGVPFADVNALMNSARIGVVCGVHDGAPAILTEYMLAGLPVLANSELVCGLHYITPKTGRAVPADQFAEAIVSMLGQLDFYETRQTVIDNWTWADSVRKLPLPCRARSLM